MGEVTFHPDKAARRAWWHSDLIQRKPKNNVKCHLCSYWHGSASVQPIHGVIAGQLSSYQTEIEFKVVSPDSWLCGNIEPCALLSLTLQTEVLRAREIVSSPQHPSRWKVLIRWYFCGPMEPQGAELLMELCPLIVFIKHPFINMRQSVTISMRKIWLNVSFFCNMSL